jgi:hypothetical protein
MHRGIGHARDVPFGILEGWSERGALEVRFVGPRRKDLK